MTATATPNASWAPIGNSAAPPSVLRNLAASAQEGRGQFVTVSPSTGNSQLNDGTVPNQISGGVAYPSPLSGLSTVAGAASNPLWIGWGTGLPASTIASDGFTDADFGVPFFIKDENTPGKLSNNSGSNRSMGGLVFGLDPATQTPVLWSGPVAWNIARAAHMANANTGASIYKVIDAGAGTDTVNGIAECVMPRGKHHGTVVAVEFIVSGATLAASGNTDFTTLTVFKRDVTGATQTSLATITTKVNVFTQFTTLTFVLSAVAGALDLLETDIITLAKTHGGNGAVVPEGHVRVIMKVG